MNISIIGTWYVGLVSGTCLAEFGMNVTCIDNNSEKIKNLNDGIIPIYEPGLEGLVKKNINEERIKFVTNLSDGIKHSEAIFIAVGTPSRIQDGHADLSFVFKAAEEIANCLNGYTVIVNKSTVPVGTGKKVFDIIKKKNKNLEFDVASNPEFLREGSAINDFMRPDRIVIGTDNKKSEKIMRELYRPLYLRETPLFVTSIESSEIIKYASNSFLATKISFINEVSDLCEVVGANVQDVSDAMGIDQRIGPKFLNAGPGYGGSCFPKDVKAFISTAKKFDTNLTIINAVHESNKKRVIKIVDKIEKNTKKNSSLTILGLSFKPNTDDIRESTSIKIANLLHDKGYQIKCYDPEAMENVKNEKYNFHFYDTALDACRDAHAIIIGTEWNEFRALNLNDIGKIVNEKIIFDLRNIYNKDEVIKMGYKYYGTGK